MNKWLLAFAGFALLCEESSAVPSVYTYTGTPYSFIRDDDPPPGTYTSNMKVSGSITLAAPIPSNASTGNFFGDAAEVLSYSFDDGRFQYAKGNIIPFGAGFSFVTDASAGIVDWTINIFGELPAAEFSSAQFRSIGSCGGTLACDAAVALALTSGTDSGESFVPGSWVITAIPEPESYALLIAGIALVGLALRGRRGVSARNPW